MRYQITAEQILLYAGGKNNIIKVSHCSTRLRLVLKNEDLFREEDMKQVKEVLGVIKREDEFQVVVGLGISAIYGAFIRALHLEDLMEEESSGEKEKIGILKQLLEGFNEIIAPILPALIGCGVFKSFVMLLVIIGWLDGESDAFRVLTLIGDGAFYFMPVLLSYTASLYFKCNPVLAVILGGILMHPNVTAMFSKGTVRFFGFRLKDIAYSSSIIAIIIVIWLMSVISKKIDQLFTDRITNVVKSFLILIICSLAGILVIGPLLGYGGDLLAYGVNYIADRMNWLGVMILAAIYPFLSLGGIQYNFLPFMNQALSETGYDIFLSAAILASNAAVAGAAFGVILRTKNRELKLNGLLTAVTAMFGIPEPAMYGVVVRMGRPMIGVLTGGLIGGLYAGLTEIKNYGDIIFQMPLLPSYISQTPMNLINASIAGAIAFIVAFLTTVMLGIPEKEEQEELKSYQVA